MARDLKAVSADLREAFGWGEPFRDPGVAAFGLENAVFAVGDTFVEVVSPAQEGTAAGRYLEARGGNSGYMAIFQVRDVRAARRRACEAGVRIVWSADHEDIAGTHLHPKDLPGAIVSLDWADPPESWRWAGPAWTGGAPPHGPGGLAGLTVAVPHPRQAAERWGKVLGLEPQGTEVPLRGADQLIRFVPGPDGRAGGISEIWLRSAPTGADVAGVRFVAVGC